MPLSMPSGSLGIVTGIVAGTGAAAKQRGVGVYQYGAQASWQPTWSMSHLLSCEAGQ